MAKGQAAQRSTQRSQQQEGQEDEDQKKNQHHEQAGGRSHEFKSALSLRIRIASRGLLNGIEQSLANHVTFMENSHGDPSQDRGHAKTEDGAQRPKARPASRANCRVGVAAATNSDSKESCAENSDGGNDQPENHSQRRDQAGYSARPRGLRPANR